MVLQSITERIRHLRGGNMSRITPSEIQPKSIEQSPEASVTPTAAKIAAQLIALRRALHADLL